MFREEESKSEMNHDSLLAASGCLHVLASYWWHIQTMMVCVTVCFRLYDDLNDFLETKERVISITRIMSMVRLSNHNCSIDGRFAWMRICLLF